MTGTLRRTPAEGRYQIIWRIVSAIPRGRVATYGDIARIAGIPNGARQVGYALHNVPHGMPVPWHRVINGQGRISFPLHHPHHREQLRLLAREGILFLNGKLDLSRWGWKRQRRSR